MRSLRRRPLLLAAGLLIVLVLAPAPAQAHEGQPLRPHDLWQAWNWQPLVLASLLLAGVAYGRGVQSVWRQAGRGRAVSWLRIAAFGAGLMALFVALVSPLEAMAGVLFWAHMVQHHLLMLVAPPLLILGKPQLVFVWALPAARRRALNRWWQRRSYLRQTWALLTRPIVVWLLYALIFWTWHIPALYEAALQSELVHTLEHFTFFGSAILFWWTLAHCRLRGRRMTYGLGILFVFATALQGGLLGWLLTFTTEQWYPTYAGIPAEWGLTPHEDQQLAGVIMWVPAGILYAATALVLLGTWLQTLERRGSPAARETSLPQEPTI